MNKIYQVIWSKTKHMYVVVSEIARRDGKTKSEVHSVGTQNRGTSLFDRLSGSACAVGITLALMLGAAPVSAASVVTSDDTSSYVSQYWIDGTNAGVNGTIVDTANVTYAIAIGNQTKVYADNGLAFGSNTYTGKALTLTDGKITYTNDKIPLIDFNASAIDTSAATSKNSLSLRPIHSLLGRPGHGFWQRNHGQQHERYSFRPKHESNCRSGYGLW